MIDQLPTDVILEITRHCDLQSIGRLSLCNSELYNKLQYVQSHHITRFLKNMRTYSLMRNSSMKKTEMFYLLDHFMINVYRKLVIPINDITLNSSLNRVYNFWKQNGSVRLYDNMYELMFFFLYVQMYHNKDIVNYKFFLALLMDHNTYISTDLKRQYMQHLLQSTDDIILTLNELRCISMYVVDLRVLRKMFTFTALNLENVFFCPFGDALGEPTSETIAYFVDIRYKYSNDDVICHNYNEIKTFLSKWCPNYFTMIHQCELGLINRYIKVLDPFTNRKIRYTGQEFQTLIRRIYRTHDRHNPIYQNLQKIIMKRQIWLQSVLFA